MSAIAFSTNSPGDISIYINNKLIGSIDFNNGISCSVKSGYVTYKAIAYNGQRFEKRIFIDEGNIQSINFPICWICGKWRDDNSYITFHESGKLYVKWDNGSETSGTWNVERDNLILYYRNQNGYSYNKITSVGLNSFKYRENTTGYEYVARRVN